jgi:carbon-monoxide dehydrogenase medium subunit
VYPTPFIYHVATSQEHAIDLLHEYGEDAKILAGGQSLVPMMNLRLLQLACLIDINEIVTPPVAQRDGALVLPAGTRHATLLTDALVRDLAPMVAEAAQFIGNVRVRARGTVGGTIAHADPGAELACVLTALGGEIVAKGPSTSRRIGAEDFFRSYLETTLEPTELVHEVHVPVSTPHTGQAFVEYARRAGEFAVVEAAAVIALDGPGGRCTRAALAYGCVADRPVSLDEEAERALRGERPSEDAFREIVERAATMVRPPDDVHASASYRRQLVKTVGLRALRTAAARAEES